MPEPDDTWWANADPISYGPPVGTPVATPHGRVVPAEDPPEETDDGAEAIGGAYDPVRNPGPNVAGLSAWASNGEDVYEIAAPSIPYGPIVPEVRPGQVRGAREFAPTQSVFLNDLEITRGPGHFAQPVPAVKVPRVPAPAWGRMRPQPITRPRAPEEFPARPRTFTRTGVFD